MHEFIKNIKCIWKYAKKEKRGIVNNHYHDSSFFMDKYPAYQSGKQDTEIYIT